MKKETNIDKWWVKNNAGSDNSYFWGTTKEAAKWTELTGETLEPCEHAEETSSNEFNLQDAINGL